MKLILDASKRMGIITTLAFSASLLAYADLNAANKNDWTEGATKDFYNRAAALPWKHTLGDWRDRNDTPQGRNPYALTIVEGSNRAIDVDWDITELVKEWASGKHPNQGVLLRTEDKRGNILFRSREGKPSQRPRLVIAGSKKEATLTPEADTFLSTSTHGGLGNRSSLNVRGGMCHALVRFELPGKEELGEILSAKLRLVSYKQYARASVGVFRCYQGHHGEAAGPTSGLASEYHGDSGIERDSRVLLFEDFEEMGWHRDWSEFRGRTKLVQEQEDPELVFEPLTDTALRVTMAEGSSSALNTLFKFHREFGREPEELYFRYYLRLADSWNQTLESGKLPGLSGTYGKGGWGGRRGNGRNGWSARGLFRKTIPRNNPLGGTTPIGTYCYHADMKTSYGSNWIWDLGYRGYLENNRWYCIEQHVKLNSGRAQNGILRGWVDGYLAFEKANVRFRLVDRLKIEQLWMNVYHGGKQKSPRDQHLYIDNVVVATDYVGPMLLVGSRNE